MAVEGASVIIVGGTAPPMPRRDALNYAWSIGLTYLMLHIATWSVLPTFVSDSINRDTVQIVYWGRELEWGYFKHPPLISWFTEFVVSLFVNGDVVIYVSSEFLLVISFIMIYKLSMKYLSPLQSVMAVVALPVMGYYSYLVPHLNHNIVLIPVWASTIFFAYQAIEGRRARAWIWLGLCIGLGILCKYTTLILPALIFLYVAATPAHRPLLRRPEPWLGVALCLLVVLPHLVWLVRNGFPTLQYLAASAVADDGDPLWRHLINPLGGVLKMLGMCASLVLLLIGGLGLPRRQLTSLRSGDRFLLVMTAGPVVLVALLSLLTGGVVHNEWATPFFIMLPTLLLLLFYPEPTARQLNRFLVWVSGLSAAMIAVYLAIYSGVLPLAEEAQWARFPARDLAAGVSEGWQRVCGGAVPVVVGDSWLAGTAAYRLPERPRVYTEADPAMAPWLSDRAIRDTGAVIVWEADRLGRFREIDHMDAVAEGQPADWFPGVAALEARFGALVRLPDIMLTYPVITGIAPVRLSRAVVPPARPCPEVVAQQWGSSLDHHRGAVVAVGEQGQQVGQGEGDAAFGRQIAGAGDVEKDGAAQPGTGRVVVVPEHHHQIVKPVVAP